MGTYLAVILEPLGRERRDSVVDLLLAGDHASGDAGGLAQRVEEVGVDVLLEIDGFL